MEPRSQYLQIQFDVGRGVASSLFIIVAKQFSAAVDERIAVV